MISGLIMIIFSSYDKPYFVFNILVYWEMFIAVVGDSGGSQSNRISNSPFLQNYIIFYNNIYKLFSKHKIY